LYAGHKEHAGHNSGAGDRGTQVRLQDDQDEKNNCGRKRGQQRVPPFVHRLGAALKKICQEENQRGFGDFRRLEGKRAPVKPAVCVMRTVKEENRNQHQRSQAEQRKYNRRMLVATVIDLHGYDHSHHSRNGPGKLANQEGIRRAEPLLGYDG